MVDLYKVKVPEHGSWLYLMQQGMKKSLGFTIPLLHARGVFNYDVGMIPYRREVNSVVGHPLFPKRTPEPTDQDVAEFQKIYMDELQRMWDEWKDVFAKDRLPGRDGEMQFVM